jgi:hypothetical protein
MCDDSWKIWNVKHVRNSPNTKPVKTGKMKQSRGTTPSFGLTIPGIQGRVFFLKFRILAGFLSELLRAAARSTPPPSLPQPPKQKRAVLYGII